MSAVLLRKLFTNDFSDWWASLAPELQAGVKSELIKAIQEELTPPVKRKVCDATAELARNMIGEYRFSNIFFVNPFKAYCCLSLALYN